MKWPAPIKIQCPIVLLQAIETIKTDLSHISAISHKKNSDNNEYGEQVASIVNSSGTGGRLKGILLTHQNIIDVVLFYKQELANEQIQSILCVLPCFAIYPCVFWLAAFANGTPTYFADAKKMGLLANSCL